MTAKIANWRLAKVLGGAASLLLVVAAGPAFAQGTSFFDGFDSLDLKRWYVSDGWANGEFQNCTWSDDVVRAEGGVLNVGYAPVPAGERDNSCGELQTRQAFGHGTFEARLKTPSGSGLNAAFFTYIGPTQGVPHDEIDFEILLRNTSEVQTTTFVNGVSGDGEVGSGEHHELPYSSDSDFIDFAVTWTPDKIDFYINKELVRTMTEPHTIPTNPMRVFFSLWGTDTLTDWMGEFERPVEPIAMQVDWVAFTALGEECAFDESVLCAQ
ncbi:family 16 glycosylhydrolase [Devosia nitrariae]|uniref:Endo-1,3-1,4-beta-glycanase n=1 Tax=Devosia nitrariae TaxID=2071872 RepID=A0ABQ5VYS1_9HYPH|nr:family 16 glycosylhydrolase [Devosia nitrariae]GLQ52758.1 endo-1,3-1,4-beta-glycanase [Devosia nitrariae]